jgi:hypothetical protein
MPRDSGHLGTWNTPKLRGRRQVHTFLRREGTIEHNYQPYQDECPKSTFGATNDDYVGRSTVEYDYVGRSTVEYEHASDASCGDSWPRGAPRPIPRWGAKHPTSWDGSWGTPWARNPPQEASKIKFLAKLLVDRVACRWESVVMGSVVDSLMKPRGTPNGP